MKASNGENANMLWVVVGVVGDEGREMINYLSRADIVFHVKTEREVMARLLQLCASIIPRQPMSG